MLPHAFLGSSTSTALARFEKAAELALQRASERKLDVPEFLVLRYQIAFLKDDKAEMEHL